ncbi:MAG TPA: T9SS type A sorting domain-containing protein [Bacteroidia bacterium]|nr:T9SS type A sorting domain-containing protein [Bacteroidia bacterium]
MKTKLKSMLVIASMVFSLQSNAVNVTIIESLSGNSWAVQDTVWRSVAFGMGYTASIVPQSALDDTANLSATDILIVASGTISYTGTNHIQTIRQYVLSGRPAYIQSEYLGSFGGTILFDSIMQTVGTNFNWIGTISGQLVPMNILGTFATTPNNTDTLNYFNYGYAGTGTGVEKFLEYQGNYFGFCYSDPTCTNGTVITISDEDWVWSNQSPELMENILYRLANDCATSIKNIDTENSSLNIFPNPFKENTQLSFKNDHHDLININLIDISGRVIKTFSTAGSKFLLDASAFEKGIYILRLINTSTSEIQGAKLVKQ